MNKQTRGGVLRVSKQFMDDFFSDLMTGKKKLVNKNLKLVGLTRLNDDILFWTYAYDFVFTADDLAIISEGCNPDSDSLKIEEIKSKKNCYKLVPK